MLQSFVGELEDVLQLESIGDQKPMNYLYEVELVTKPNVERREIVAAIFAPAEMEARIRLMRG